MKSNRVILTVLSALLSQTALIAQTAAPAAAAAAPAARAGRGGAAATVQVAGASAEQQAAVTAMEQGVAPLVQALATARTELSAASFAEPRNDANLRAKIEAVRAAEQALAAARATSFAQMQSAASSLNAEQVQSLVAAQLGGGGRAGGRAGGRGGAGGTKTLLIWADTRNGQSQHAMTSHAMSVIERLGYESGAYQSFIRTDSEIISYSPQMTTGRPASGGPSLNSVDAIFSLVHREAPLPESQKAELMKFVKEDGKGFITGHTGLTAFTRTWPEFEQMIGGGFGGHNIGMAGTVVVEDSNFAGVKDWPLRSEMTEEWYTLLNFSRERIHVILRLDLSVLPPMAATAQMGGDFPVAWSQQVGNGRIFSSTFAHATQTWDNPLIQKLYFEGIKWALKITDADMTPRPLPKDAVLPLR